MASLVAAELAGKVQIAASTDCAAGQQLPPVPAALLDGSASACNSSGAGESKDGEVSEAGGPQPVHARRMWEVASCQLPVAPLPMSHITMLKQLLGGDSSCKALYGHHCKAGSE